MIHQAEEKRKICRVNPLFIECQDKGAASGPEQKIGILDTFGYAFVRQQCTDVVAFKKCGQIGLCNFGVDRHSFSPVHKGHVGSGQFNIAQFAVNQKRLVFLNGFCQLDGDGKAVAIGIDNFGHHNFRR